MEQNKGVKGLLTVITTPVNIDATPVGTCELGLWKTCWVGCSPSGPREREKERERECLRERERLSTQPSQHIALSCNAPYEQ